VKILVTGGAGYIGSHICKNLYRKGLEPIVFDNLSNGHKKFVKWGDLVVGDLKNFKDLSKLDKFNFKGVIHLASNIEVGESYKNPSKFYKNNIAGFINLIDFVLKKKIRNFIFSSTAAVYGEPGEKKIKENFITNPISPYGKSKLYVEKMLEDYSNIFGINFCSFRYFNASGADEEMEIGELHNPETHLIPNLIEACENKKFFKIFGNNYNTKDGTCMRDYVHVSDIAEAHVIGLRKLIKNKMRKINYINLGSGKSYSVLEVLEEVQKFKKKKINFKFEKKRHGDPPILISNINKAKKILNWSPKRSGLNNIVKTSYKWYLSQKKSYKKK